MRATDPISTLRIARLLALSALAAVLPEAVYATEQPPRKVAVYGFELKDFSAGGGIIAPDERDVTYLAAATDEAKRQLAQSGRYTVVDTAPVGDEPAVKAHQLRDCGKCIGTITQRLGAEQAVLGTVTRINRTEYTLLIQFFDATTGEPAASYYTSLRMGANYAWPRGVTWLMKNRILLAAAPQ